MLNCNMCNKQCFFVTVRAGTAYRKIWRLVNNFFARIIRFTVKKFQLFWVIFCIIIFFIELWHILILWSAKMPNGGMPVLHWLPPDDGTRKYSFTKKALATNDKLSRQTASAQWLECMRPRRAPLDMLHWSGAAELVSETRLLFVFCTFH